ncbi:hypothetical protein E2C01_043374 [Portunus trituberculatus]|uniref:Uncharacterized protein n=1 Tax=Portunus trituberculatus TaxID=210409 RepID=A0A5B7FVZ9_PORTR|nr:hypothetical protein [Portunus trituberculatus]
MYHADSALPTCGSGRTEHIWTLEVVLRPHHSVLHSAELTKGMSATLWTGLLHQAPSAPWKKSGTFRWNL